MTLCEQSEQSEHSEQTRNVRVLRLTATESWNVLVWVRRLIPLVIIAVLYGGYTLWDDWRIQSRADEMKRTALLTARVWVGTASFAGEPDRFILWRDSLLAAEGVTLEDMHEFLDRYRHPQDQYLEFARLVKLEVDSLAKEAETRRREQFTRPDSTQSLDSAANSISTSDSM